MAISVTGRILKSSPPGALASSEGNLMKALEPIYAQAGSVSAPVQGASKHWDQILTGDIYNAKMC